MTIDPTKKPATAGRRLWTFLTTPKAVDPENARREFKVKAILAITAFSLVPFTLFFITLFAVDVFNLLDLLDILFVDLVVAVCLLLSRGRAWRASGLILCFLFLALPGYLTLSMGGWSPISVYYALFVALGITLLGDRTAWGVVLLGLAAYACTTVIHGDSPPLEVANLMVAVAAPLCGIALLMRFSSRQMTEALTSSRLVTAGLQREVAERKRMEMAVRELMERNRALFESIPDGIGVLLLDGRFADCNGAAVRILDAASREEILGRSIFDVIIPEEQARARSWLSRMQVEDSRQLERVTIRSLTGRVFDAQLFSGLLRGEGGAPVGLVLAVRDITDQLSLEAQLRQAQKMEAVGQLAGGVAHDFNNILLGIQGYTELAREAAGDNRAAREHLDEVLTAAERGGALVRQLLAFSRREALLPAVVSLNELIEGLVKMVSRLIGEHIRLRLELQEDIRGVTADARQLEQALVNLCVNSRDAMPEGGTIVIGTENVTLDGAFASAHPWAAPGQYVLVRLSDDGTGMAPEAMAHLFEPFFTTKRPDRGTGIGLATVYGIVKQHGGLINCESTPGAGTRFFLYFPASGEAPQASPPTPPEQAVKPAGGRETLLIAEDDTMVRSLVTRILHKAGYRVLAAADGTEALSVFASQGADIALALIDVVMPGMNGQALAQALRNVRPTLPVLFSSGYDFHLLDDALEGGEKLTIVHKPYHPQELLRIVREMLDAAEKQP